MSDPSAALLAAPLQLLVVSSTLKWLSTSLNLISACVDAGDEEVSSRATSAIEPPVQGTHHFAFNGLAS